MTPGQVLRTRRSQPAECSDGRDLLALATLNGVSDRRRHRGPHPLEAELFAEECLQELRVAVSELSWLEERGYSQRAALALVGDRHQLRSRQRLAVLRCATAVSRIEARRARRVAAVDLVGRQVAIDGFNVIITLEAALSGGVVLVGRDGVHRDLASVHGSYRRVEETTRAIELLGEVLAPAAHVRWFFDQPVSNSGRLKAVVERIADERSWTWSVEVVRSPDNALCGLSGSVVATSDGPLLDRVGEWTDLPGHLIETAIPAAWLVDLR